MQHFTGQTVKPSSPCDSGPCDLAFLTEEQLTKQLLMQREKFNHRFLVCMANHYASGVYIDAEIEMKNAYAAMGRILDYAYTHRSSVFYDALNNLLAS